MRELFIDDGRIRICQTELARIIDLRHKVLRAGLPREMAVFPGDELPTNWHFGAFRDEQNIGCATFHLSQWQNEPAWQLRGMATDASMRAKDVGKELLAFAERRICEESPLRLFWCNARTPALGFYRKQGWQAVGDEFFIETAGPHFKMFKRVE